VDFENMLGLIVRKKNDKLSISNGYHVDDLFSIIHFKNEANSADGKIGKDSAKYYKFYEKEIDIIKSIQRISIFLADPLMYIYNDGQLRRMKTYLEQHQESDISITVEMLVFKTIHQNEPFIDFVDKILCDRFEKTNDNIDLNNIDELDDKLSTNSDIDHSHEQNNENFYDSNIDCTIDENVNISTDVVDV
jgi:hypothetical protein